MGKQGGGAQVSSGGRISCTMPASTPCSCLWLLVDSNGPHKGLSPLIIHPCPTHLPPRPRPRLHPHTLVPLVNPVPEPSSPLVQEIQPGHEDAVGTRKIICCGRPAMPPGHDGCTVLPTASGPDAMTVVFTPSL